MSLTQLAEAPARQTAGIATIRDYESWMGVRGLWSSLKKTGLTGRIISSRKSIM